MMKVKTITVIIEADEDDAEDVTMTYSSATRRWVVSGPAYPRHLKMCSEIIGVVRTADTPSF